MVATDDAALDRTVAALLEPGLEVGGRSVRPARVAVHRHRPLRDRGNFYALTSSSTSSDTSKLA